MNKKLIVLLVLAVAVSAQLTYPAAPSSHGADLTADRCRSLTAAYAKTNYADYDTGYHYVIVNKVCTSCLKAGCVCTETDLNACSKCLNPRDALITIGTESFCVAHYADSANLLAETWTGCPTANSCVNAKERSVTCNCPAGTYAGINECKTCGTDCAACTAPAKAGDPVKCSKCVAGAYLDANSACVKCADVNCAECSSDGKTCKTCKATFFLDKTPACTTCGTGAVKCTAADAHTECAPGYFLDATAKKCTACGASCRTCTSKDVCTICNGDATLNPQNDWVGLYLNSSGVCTVCTDTTAATKPLYCSSTGASTVCREDQVVHEGKCYTAKENCVTHALSGSTFYCKTCKDTYYADAGECVLKTAEKYQFATVVTADNTAATVTCTTASTHAKDAGQVCRPKQANCGTSGTTTVTIESVKTLTCTTCSNGYLADGDGVCRSTALFATANVAKVVAGPQGSGILLCKKPDTDPDAAGVDCTANTDCAANHYFDSEANKKTCYPTGTCSATRKAAGCATCDATNGCATCSAGYTLTGDAPSKTCAVCSTSSCAACPAGKWLNGAQGCVDITVTTGCDTYDATKGCATCKTTPANKRFLKKPAAGTTAAQTCDLCNTNTETYGAKCDTCTEADGCTSCTDTDTVVSKKCITDANCFKTHMSVCVSCKKGYKIDTNGECKTACDATKGCTVVANGNCDLAAKPPGATTVTTTSSSSSAILSFAFALLLVLAVLF